MIKKTLKLAIPAVALAGALGAPAAQATATDTPTAVAAGVKAYPVDDRQFIRLAGSNRYKTAVEISRYMFFGDGPFEFQGKPLDRIYVASGEDFPDALAAGPASAKHGPLLLVPKSGPLPQEVRDEIVRLGIDDIVIVGGRSSVSAEMEDNLRWAVEELPRNITRISGPNRYATAAALTRSIMKEHAVKTVVVTNGTTYADALGGSGGAALANGGLLLTSPTSLPEVTRSTIQAAAPQKVFVLGGTGSVSDGVLRQVKAAAPNASVVRVAGANRYETAAKFSASLFPGGSVGYPGGSKYTPSNAVVTTGTNFPDALAGSTGAWTQGAPVLLTPNRCMASSTSRELDRIGAIFIFVAGGAAADGSKELCG